MVYDIPNNWGFGLCSSSDILKNTKEHNVSETESVRDTYSVGSVGKS
jgi:hypothetical protein